MTLFSEPQEQKRIKAIKRGITKKGNTPFDKVRLKIINELKNI